jgi:hypothetical protein
MVPITPEDDVAITVNGRYPRRIFVGGTGDINFYDEDGNLCKWQSVPAGLYTVSYTGVADTGTTATKMIALS